MDNASRIERTLSQALKLNTGVSSPPLLEAAIRYAVMPGGARIRPKLCLAAARACGDDEPTLAAAAAASIELLHCASLVHDDLPCFDDADTRRGKASVHKAYGAPLAVLTGDALIVLAFQFLARAAERAPDRLAGLIAILARSAGAATGIIGGQAWECEPQIPLAAYQRAKTGALFAAATAAGACAAGYKAPGWHQLGERLGQAYQIADDIRDVVCSEAQVGKPTGRDLELGRPNMVHSLGLAKTVERLEELVQSAVDSVPECEGAHDLKAHIRSEAARLLPREMARPAA
jgi:geranylgeranyl diphosphate synthase, type II